VTSPAAYRPDLYFGIAFNADPNDNSVAPEWTELTNQLRSFSGVSRGKQYELDEAQSAQPKFVLRDPGQDLNPVNTSGDYYPNVLPFRQYLFMAAAPNPISGNLLANYPGVDTSFESYGVGVDTGWVRSAGASVPPVVTTGTAHDGNRCIVYTSDLDGGVEWDVYTMPGRTYSASCWWKQNGSETQGIQVVDLASTAYGSSTNVSGAWVRFHVTFVAEQPVHRVQILSTTGATVTRIDSVMIEEGSSTSTYTSDGSTLFSVSRGYIERWPTKWQYAGWVGVAELTGVDTTAVLAGIEMHTELVAAHLALDPTYYWPLWDREESSTFAEIMGNGPQLVRHDSRFGPAPDFASATETGIVGDPGGTGLLIAGTMDPIHPPISTVSTGVRGTTPVYFGSDTLPASFTVSMWVSHSTLETDFDLVFGFLARSLGQTGTSVLEWYLYGDTPRQHHFRMWTADQFATQTVDDTYDDDLPHHYVMVCNVQSTQASLTVYIDGVSLGTATDHTAAGVVKPLASVQIGGEDDEYQFDTYDGLPDGVWSHLAIWQRALSPTEVSTLWTAGDTGMSGELTSERISRYLAENYEATATDIGDGATILGPSAVQRGDKLLPAVQRCIVSENGNYWTNTLGYPAFRGRNDRYTNVTPVGILGERASNGEIPYEGDIAYDFDPQFVNNDVTVTQTNGIVQRSEDAASIKRYFRRGVERDSDALDPADVIDHANYLLAKRKDPKQRVEQITIKPTTDAMWQAVLGWEINDLVTVRRRLFMVGGLITAANFFIERISHSGDMEDGTWETLLMLSPASLWSVGLFDSATWGVLDSTFVFAH